MVKATYVDKNGVKKGSWSEEEDDKLRAYILRYGHWNWRLLPKFAGLDRCGKSCRLRWMNYLKPGIKRGNFSQEERDLIAKLHHELGNKWSAIAAKLPGRTDNDIKNYWYGHISKPSKRTGKSGQQEEQSCQTTHRTASSDVTSVSPRRGPGELANPELPSNVFILESSSSNLGDVDSDLDSSLMDKTCSETLQELNPLSVNSRETDDSFIFPDLLSGFHESFWTQPFMVDTYSYNHDCGFSVLDEGALLSPHFSCFDDNAMNMS